MKVFVCVLGLVAGLAAADLSGHGSWARAEAAGGESDEAAALDFVRMGFERNDVRGAFQKYVAPNLVEHDPEFGDGRDSVFKYIEKRRRSHPNEYLPDSQWTNHMDYVAFKDDMLITKMHVFARKNDRGRVFADFWRFKNGKIVEHWDIIQEVPANKANPRPMW